MVTERDTVYETEILAHVASMMMVLEQFQTKQTFEIEDYLAMERAIQILIESMVGMSRYILKIKVGKSMAKSGEVIDDLRRHNFITESDHEECRKMIGYRNVLVHDDLNINPAITAGIVRSGIFRQIDGLIRRLIHSL